MIMCQGWAGLVKTAAMTLWLSPGRRGRSLMCTDTPFIRAGLMQHTWTHTHNTQESPMVMYLPLSVAASRAKFHTILPAGVGVGESLSRCATTSCSLCFPSAVVLSLAPLFVSLSPSATLQLHCTKSIQIHGGAAPRPQLTLLICVCERRHSCSRCLRGLFNSSAFIPHDMCS